MREEQQKQQDQDPIDLNTGEEKPPAENAGEVDELVPYDTGERTGEEYLLNEETSMDKVAADNQANAVVKKTTRYTEDKNTEQTFKERQKLVSGGRDSLQSDLENHHALSPVISAGDLDADWQSANVAGEEAVGGSAPTPDQDVVEEIGEALGLTYDPDEPLGSEEKLRQRDRERWELNPKSAEDQSENTDQDTS